ncbi:MAG: DUF374 domain-containing protein [Novipirellula sp. JB048]
MDKQFAWLLGCAVGLLVTMMRWTLRFHYHHDSRADLTARGIGHVYASLHAHQIAGSMAAERGTVAMVSRSTDGEIVAPLLRFCGHEPVRGSSGASRKGGTTALNQMIRRVNEGQVATLAIDGPRGPRGRVYGGAAMLGMKTNAAVLPAIVIPRRRWILKSTWDRLQFPLPFTRVDVYFGDPLRPGAGESLEAFTLRIEAELHRLEWTYDPAEARYLAVREAAAPQRAA